MPNYERNVSSTIQAILLRHYGLGEDADFLLPKSGNHLTSKKHPGHVRHWYEIRMGF